MIALTNALSAALLHFLWQGLVVALLLWITLFVLRRASANARYIACCTALAILAILPVITAAWTYEAQIPTVVSNSVVATSSLQTTSSGAFPGAIRASWLAWVQSWALTAWSAGVLFFSLRIVWGCRYIYVLKRQGQAADERIQQMLQRLASRMRIARHVRVLLSSLADAPSVVGWLRPVVLLPASSVIGLTPEQLEAVIAHELAHVRRLDYLVSAFQVVIETLLFYHPAVWWTSSRIRHERELCCDDAVIRCCGNALCYAHALTTLEKQRVLKPSMVLGAGGSGLFYRIQRIIGVKNMEYGPSKVSGVLVFSLALAGVAANLSWLRAEPQTQEAAAKKIEQANTGFAIRNIVVAPAGQDSSGVSVNLGGATVVHRTGIEYPRAAIANGIQGPVSAEVTLDSAGNVVDARILSGPTELRRAVLGSVLQWHFVSDSAQNTRVIHVNFDSAAVQQERVEWKRFATGNDEAEARALREKLTRAQEELQNTALAKQLDNSRVETAEVIKQKTAAVIEAEKQNGRNVEEIKLQQKLEAELATMQGKLKVVSVEKPASAIGRVVKSIRLIGFATEQSQGDLASRLPLRVGDEVSRELIEKTGATVRQFDEHLEYRFIPLEQNGTELQIIVPGARRPLY